MIFFFYNLQMFLDYWWGVGVALLEAKIRLFIHGNLRGWLYDLSSEGDDHIGLTWRCVSREPYSYTTDHVCWAHLTKVSTESRAEGKVFDRLTVLPASRARRWRNHDLNGEWYHGSFFSAFLRAKWSLSSVILHLSIIASKSGLWLWFSISSAN